MILPAVKEVAELALIVGLLYFALSWLARRRRGEWSESMEGNRMLILLLLALAVTAVKVGEDVLGGESGPVDEATLLFIRDHVPRALEGFFRAVTFTGSWRILFPLVMLLSAAFLAARKHFEALLLTTSAVASALAI